MAKKADVFTATNNDTVISSGVSLKGNMSSEGDIAIDGALAGNIKSGGHVSVGVNARISGSIQATSVQIGGHVQGNVTAIDTISLLETAQLRGDATTSRLEIGLGAVFIGTSNMKPIEATEVGDVEEV